MIHCARCTFVRHLNLTRQQQNDIKKVMKNKKNDIVSLNSTDSELTSTQYASQFSLSFTQRKCSFSLQIPSWPEVLLKSQMLLSSSLKTGACCWVSLGLKYSSTSWVVACPSTLAWKATKLRRSTNSSSCSVGGAGEELVPGAPVVSSSSSASPLWLEGTLR